MVLPEQARGVFSECNARKKSLPFSPPKCHLRRALPIRAREPWYFRWTRNGCRAETRITMLRLVVSGLLLPAVLLQGMGFCHSRAGACLHAPACHEQGTHFHLCMVGLNHHAHASHHVHQDRKPNGHGKQALGERAPADDHGDDAVSASALAMLGGRSWYSQAASAEYSVLVPMEARAGSALATSHSRLLAHPSPSLVCRTCPVYLRTLALLI